MHLSRAAAIVGICGALAAACGQQASSGPGARASEPEGVEVVGAEVARAAPAPDDEVAALTAAQAAFALDLYHAVRREHEGDLVIGPSSLHTVLAMVRAGARGATADEMDRVLHAEGLALHAAGNALDQSLLQRNEAGGIELATANRLWVQHGLTLTDEFVATVAGNYGAAIAATDIAGDPEAARQAANAWVAAVTRAKIEDLFPQGSIDASSRLVLANAVYLDAAWRFPFDPEGTSDEPFRLGDGTTANVPTMHYDEYLPTAIGPDWVAVKLPYDGEDLSMTVIVPQDLPRFEESLDVEHVSTILGQITDGGIHLSLPRFTARTHLGLNEALSAMGMPTAFGGGADFSGMTGTPDLWIQTVEHEAVVEVDEEGTEAAAASGGVMQGSHGPTITVDRPFLFLIRDEPTGAILFLGRVTDPR